MGDFVSDIASKLTENAQFALDNFLLNVVNTLPNLLIALIIFVVGWGVGSIFGLFVRKLLEKIKFEQYLRSHGLEDALGKVQITSIVVQLVKYYIWLVFIQAAVAQLNLGTITDFMTNVLLYAPVVIGSLAVVVTAAVFGEWVFEKFLESGKEPYLKTTGKMAKYLIIFLSVLVGLDTIGFDTSVIKLLILTGAQGLSWGVALAVGVSFGLGGQETAKDMIKSFRKVFHI
ncbi:hypothetical protein J4450_08440 [Candidatus Micrarchaeota archaeon]|nr:hypothetical protein [Candidatus Micrarchaeota archaeon]